MFTSQFKTNRSKVNPMALCHWEYQQSLQPTVNNYIGLFFPFNPFMHPSGSIPTITMVTIIIAMAWLGFCTKSTWLRKRL